MVLGGLPCQGFSKAGTKKIGDARNALYLEMKHAVATLQPALFIAENVDGISQNFSGAYLKRIIADFKEIGYTIEYRILDAIAFGLPQHRRRIVFVGIRQAARRQFQWPSETHQLRSRNGEFKVSESTLAGISTLWEECSIDRPGLQSILTIRDAIADLIELTPSIPDHQVTKAWPEKYEYIIRAIKQGQKLCNVRHAATSVYTWQIPEVFGATTDTQRLILQAIAKHRRHKQYGTIPNGNPLPREEIERLTGLTEVQPDIEALLTRGYLKVRNGMYDLKGAMFNSGLFKRPCWNEPSPTVLTNFHSPRYFLHPLRDGPFSLRECARLQGFPDTFIFTGENSTVNLLSGYRLVGNAVPPPLSRLFASAARQFLTLNERQAV